MRPPLISLNNLKSTALIGISGIDEEGELLDFDYQEVRVAQAIIEHPERFTWRQTTPSLMKCDDSFGKPISSRSPVH